MRLQWWPEPSAGDIVWCRFPQVVGTPGPKPRPALVLVVYDDDAPQFTVKVAYGTSQRTDALHSGEFLIAPANASAYAAAGLSYPTQFDCKQLLDLPFNSEWFDVAPGGHLQTPRMGTLHATLVPALKAALQRR